MNDDRLRNILQTADGAVDLPPRRSGVVERVIRRARRRRMVRRSSVAAIALIVAGGGLVGWHNRPAAPLPPQIVRLEPVNREVLRVQLAQYEKDAQLHEHLANAMWRTEASEQSPYRSATVIVPFGAREELDSEREMAAQILINRADRLMRRPDSAAEAADAYRRVIELFPDSSPAQIARDRLRQIKA